MKHIQTWRRLSGWALPLVLAVTGCSGAGSQGEMNVPVDPAKLVPTTGTVKLRGEPLAKAVVMLMNSTGIPAVGETNGEGKFVLDTASRPGALPGKYQVTISYMVSPKGNPQGLSARSAMLRSDEMLEAVEQIPPDYSDLTKTKLSADISAGGAPLSFDLPVTLEPLKSKADAKDADAPKQPEKEPAASDVTKAAASPADPAEKDAAKPAVEKKD